ncbi:ATP-binding protein [Marinobacter sediminum]|uniref:ATP-binding protein n=1 Tax=Marinobacter sediminum TaxID=256323 RepID=UPI00356ABCF1
MQTDADPTTIIRSAGSEPPFVETLARIKEIDVDHELDVYDARRGVHQQAMTLGFKSDQAHYLVTALTELANNIVFHSLGGWVAIHQILESSTDPFALPRTGIRITACDRGPGIRDIEQAKQDGFSTTNSLGCGLSGVARLMDQLDIVSSENGTRVQAVMWARGEL